jgi:serine/threonine-protein kinase
MLRPGDLVGRYRIEGLLGAGGMGEVYRAFDPQLARSVALKRILLVSQEDRPQWVLRMLREARAAAAFNHANAVAIYDVGEHDGLPFLVMELVSGKSLRAYVGAAEPDWQTRVRWMIDVARALGAAHAAGLVHRDVKPDNVMVRDDGVVKVLDFGIARSARDVATEAALVDPNALTEALPLGTITQAGGSVGTPAYMAPEQIHGDAIDGRSDQFSWGVTLFELIAGSPPWGNAQGGMKLVAAVLTRAPEGLGVRRPELPITLDRAIARTIAKLPGDRFPSMDAVIAAVAPLIDSTPRTLVVPEHAALADAPRKVDSAAGVERSPPASTAGATTRGGAALALVGLAAVAFGVAAIAVTSTSERPAPPGPSPEPVSSQHLAIPRPSSVDGATGVASSPRGRHPCKARGSCTDGATAWCDADEKDLACCARGLVAVGDDGMCECAPGGVTVPALDCARATLTRSDWERQVDPFGPSFFACLHAGDAGSAFGEVKVEASYDPDGVVFEARITNGALPQVSAQKCVLDAVRATHGPPPPDGHWHSELDFDLEPPKKN